ALQDYPAREVVLLIDDPPAPASEADRAALRAMVELPRNLQAMFDRVDAALEHELPAFEARRKAGALDHAAESHRLAELYRRATHSLEFTLHLMDRSSAGEALLAHKVVGERVAAHRARAEELLRLAREGGLDPVRIEIEYRRIASLFRVRF